MSLCLCAASDLRCHFPKSDCAARERPVAADPCLSGAERATPRQANVQQIALALRLGADSAPRARFESNGPHRNRSERPRRKQRGDLTEVLAGTRFWCARQQHDERNGARARARSDRRAAAGGTAGVPSRWRDRPRASGQGGLDVCRGDGPVPAVRRDRICGRRSRSSGEGPTDPDGSAAVWDAGRRW